MKVKIIDLIIKIANHKKLPKRIKYGESIYTLNIKGSNYVLNGTQKNLLFTNDLFAFNDLNDEVEIVEEDKKIEKLEFEAGNIDDKEFLAKYITHNRYKINEIIDEINKRKEKYL